MTTLQPLPPITNIDWAWSDEKNHTSIEMRLMRKYEYHFTQDGQDYYKFLEFVSRGHANFLTSALALLHAVIADKVATADELRQEWHVPDAIVARIERMTPEEDQPYEEYIDGLLGDKFICAVMKSVLEYNMQMHRYSRLDEATLAKLQSYHAAYQKVRRISRK